MILKSIKMGVLTVAGAAVIGGLVFGTDLVSYVTSSTKLVRAKVKDAVPIEFELRRARDLLEEIIPEMQTNVRLIAQEEVEVDRLVKALAARGKEHLQAERFTQASADCDKAVQLGGNLAEVAALRSGIGQAATDQQRSERKYAEVLDEAWRDYVAFHLDKLGCEFCRANLEDLKQQSGRDDTSTFRKRVMESTIGFLSKP